MYLRAVGEAMCAVDLVVGCLFRVLRRWVAVRPDSVGFMVIVQWRFLCSCRACTRCHHLLLCTARALSSVQEILSGASIRRSLLSVLVDMLYRLVHHSVGGHPEDVADPLESPSANSSQAVKGSCCGVRLLVWSSNCSLHWSWHRIGSLNVRFHRRTSVARRLLFCISVFSILVEWSRMSRLFTSCPRWWCPHDH